MRYSPLIILLCVSSVNGATSSSMKPCNANNCLRAVRATAPTFSTRSAIEDCSSYSSNYPTLTVTVSQSTVQTVSTTVTNTITVPLVGSASAPRKRRQASVPTPAIPAYASACSNAFNYISACSCIGVGITTQATTTVTASSTSTATTTATATVTSFIMQIQDFLPGQYVRKSPPQGEPWPRFTTDIVEAAVFRRYPDGHIEHGSSTLGANDFWDTRDFQYDNANNAMTCDIDATQALNCSSDLFNVIGLYEYGGEFWLALSTTGSEFAMRGGGITRIKALSPLTLPST